MKNKITAIILCVLLTLSVFPVWAFASNADDIVILYYDAECTVPYDANYESIKKCLFFDSEEDTTGTLTLYAKVLKKLELEIAYDGETFVKTGNYYSPGQEFESLGNPQTSENHQKEKYKFIDWTAFGAQIINSKYKVLDNATELKLTANYKKIVKISIQMTSYVTYNIIITEIKSYFTAQLSGAKGFFASSYDEFYSNNQVENSIPGTTSIQNTSISLYALEGSEFVISVAAVRKKNVGKPTCSNITCSGSQTPFSFIVGTTDCTISWTGKVS